MSDRLKNPAQQIDKLRDSILDTFFQQRQKIGYSLESSLKILRSYNPKRVLKSGYSLVRDETGKIVKSITSVKLSQKLMLELSDGIIEGKVTDVRQQESK
jgi:exonuclease VII large subunit